MSNIKDEENDVQKVVTDMAEKDTDGKNVGDIEKKDIVNIENTEKRNTGNIERKSIFIEIKKDTGKL